MDRKVAIGGGIGLPVSVILVWVFEAVMPDIKVPTEVGAAFGAVCVWAFNWLVPNR